jgi:hypothetical protein
MGMRPAPYNSVRCFVGGQEFAREPLDEKSALKDTTEFFSILSMVTSIQASQKMKWE